MRQAAAAAAADLGLGEVECSCGDEECGAGIAVGETVILLHPPPPLVGISIRTEKRCQQNDSIADG